jgi:dTDP-4-amino-4,6-dideoxygalactose transaminase
MNPDAFKSPLYVGRPNIGNREKFNDRVNEIFDTRWLSNNGPMVQNFESEIAKFIGIKHCVSVCNATIGMELVANAMELKGSVIVPTYSFIATAHAFRRIGVRPLFVDMNPKSHNIAPEMIEQTIELDTSAIVATHVWGRACEIELIQEIGERRGLPVIYDAAHAFGCSHKGRMLGNFGACEIYSFHATKFLNCFEGGAIVTNNDALAEKLRLMRNFGFQGFDNITEIGTNAKMSEIHAAMGLTNLESIEYFIEINRRNYNAYQDGLRCVPGVKVIEYDPKERNNYQYVVVEIDSNQSGKSRDTIVDFLISKNVIARKYFWPGCHNMPFYRTETSQNVSIRMSNNDRVGCSVIVLPTGETMTEGMISRVCDMIRRLVS